MKRLKIRKIVSFPLLAGLIVGLIPIFLAFGIVRAAPSSQESGEEHQATDKNCKDCHLDITDSWTHSPHAHAFDDPVFSQRWKGMGSPGNCLLCHTTNYQTSTGSYEVEGVSCEACHGEVKADHPPEVVPIRADTDYCGTCHTTTLHEWRLSGHSAVNVGCTDCHDPHSQKRLFEVSDELCINCHQGDMGDYLEDTHIQKGIGCVDCHALVIPPDPVPQDGIVPTGHTFTITPATCVACHTDSLHAGFSLPGYENGAKAAIEEATPTPSGETSSELIGIVYNPSENTLTADQQIQALEAKLSSNQLATIFQGGIIGLVLGGSTAWFVSQNTRKNQYSDDDEEK